MRYFKAAKALIVRNNKFLVIKKLNTILDNQWELPGGKLESNEDYFTALKREVKEETNLDLKIGQQLANWVIKGNDWQIDGKSYLCKPLNVAVILSKEHSEFAWIDRKDAQKFKIADAFKPIIDSWLKQKN